MKILIFEYSTCVGKDNLISEGYGILKSILNDFEYIDGYDVDYLITNNIDLDFIEKSRRIILEENLISWLESNASKYDYCLFVAPEDDYIQFRITKILEDNKVKLFTSNSNASYICCSKILTYKKVNPKILKIPTITVNVDDYNINLIKDKINFTQVICKPDSYTSSNYIFHTTKDNIEEIIDNYKNNNIKKMLIQEYIPGDAISISAIVNKTNINILSINSQIIRKNNGKLHYTGCVSPIKHPQEKKIKEISKKIIKSIPGLNGFIGIDFIINNKDIYFVEINSRITTPYIVLSKISDKNLTEYLIESVMEDNKMKKIHFNKKGDFYNEQ